MTSDLGSGPNATATEATKHRAGPHVYREPVAGNAGAAGSFSLPGLSCHFRPGLVGYRVGRAAFGFRVLAFRDSWAWRVPVGQSVLIFS